MVFTEPGSFTDLVRSFWDAAPCGTRGLPEKPGTAEFYHHLEKQRDHLDPIIPGFAEFTAWKGEKVLEVGFGAGVDFIRFAREGADLFGIDLTESGKRLVDRWLELEGLYAQTQVGDAESLPYEDNTFDLVYSWGVIHHTQDTPRAAREILRVARPGGEIRVMIYHRRSLVALQTYLTHGLLRGRPFQPVEEIIRQHIESPGTKAYTLQEAQELFSGLEDLQVTPRVTTYDLRLTRRLHAPRGLMGLLPQSWGWNLLIRGRKP